MALEDFGRGVWSVTAFSRNERRRVVGDKYFAGMKSAVDGAGAMRGVEGGGKRSQARDQIVDRRRAEVAERGFKRNTAGFGCNPKRSSVIET